MNGEEYGDVRQLLEALEMPEVQAKIREICAGEAAESKEINGRETESAAWAGQRKRLEQENAGLRDRLEQSRAELARAQERARELERGRDVLERALREAESAVRDRERALQELKARAGELERTAQDRERDFQPYQELNDLWKRFRSLPGEAGDEVRKFLPWEDPVRFFAVGCQRETIFRLWDHLCRQCQQEGARGEETLMEVLRLLLKCYNYNYSAPALELMLGEEGQPFDKNRHLRGPSCSMYQGRVTQVLLPGIWNRNKDCAERKCLVRF